MRVIPDKPTGLQQRARVADIAKAAKVSTATVDRVLNHRPGVRDATAQKVLKAAAELDCPTPRSMRRSPRNPCV